MAKPRTRPQGDARRDIASITEELAALHTMSVGELCEKYRDVIGEPTRSRNKHYLHKKIAWRIQELAEGGLSERAEAKIDALGSGLPMAWRRRLQPAETASESPAKTAAPKAATAATPKAATPKERDPRLPPTGTVLRREHQGVEHVVTVLDKGFEYRDTRYLSLSQVARAITGTQWNGLLFFGLKRRTRKRSAEEAGA